MITLCVPTMNRSPFVARLLRYYAEAGFPHQIFIGDASGPEHAQANCRLAESLRGRLQVSYHHDPGASACAALETLSHGIQTPYVAFLGDDDLLCVRGLAACIEFLERHPDYGAAHGEAVMFQTENNGPRGTLGGMKPYPQAVITAETGAARLREFFTRSLYTLLYSVHRTDNWRAMFRGVSGMPGMRNRNVFKDELIAVCVSVVRGKIKALETLYLIHQTHDTSYRFPHVFEWLTDPGWSPSYQRFQHRVVEELGRQDGMASADAEALVRELFWPFLARQVIRCWREGDTPRRKPSALRRIAKRIPGARPAVQAWRSGVARVTEELSLPSLLSAASPHHEDFMPVYHALTQEEAKWQLAAR